MPKHNPIKNATARIWTKTQLKATIKQSKDNGFEIVQDGLLKHIIDPATQNTVLTSAELSGKCMIRMDKTYFE